MKTRALAALVAVALAGCTVGPDYVRPAVDAPTAWRAASMAAGSTVPAGASSVRQRRAMISPPCCDSQDSGTRCCDGSSRRGSWSAEFRCGTPAKLHNGALLV